MLNRQEVIIMSFKMIKDYLCSETTGEILLLVGFCLLVLLLIRPLVRSELALQAIQCCALLSPLAAGFKKR
jgi:hypothetical protein